MLASRVAAAPAPARFVAPDGRGDGASWAKAAPIGRLNDLVKEVGPGGTVYLAAHRGPYTIGETLCVLSAGGAAGAPVLVMGVDAAMAPKPATVTGARTRWRLPADPEQVTRVDRWTAGQSAVRLLEGANHLTFSHLSFQHCGQSFHLRAKRHDGIEVRDCDGYNVQRFFEHDPGTSHVGTRLLRIRVTGFSKTAIRIRGDSANVLLEDMVLNSGRQDGDNFATGVECNDTAHAIVMRDVTCQNCHDTGPGGKDAFWNADGFASEYGNYDILRERCVSSGNTDAGFDDKASNLRNVECSGFDNKVNFKLWGRGVVIEACRAANPRSRGGPGPQMQVYAVGADHAAKLGADILMRRGAISSSDPETLTFVAEAHNSVIRIAGPTVAKHAKAPLQQEIDGSGNAFLFSAGAAEPPRILTAPELGCGPGPAAVLLKADQPVTWSLAPGSTEQGVQVSPDRGDGVLVISPAPGATRRRAVVRATDAEGREAELGVSLDAGRPGAPFVSIGAPDGSGNAISPPPDLFRQRFAVQHAPEGAATLASPPCGFADHYIEVGVARLQPRMSGMLLCRVSAGLPFLGLKVASGELRLFLIREGRLQTLGRANARQPGGRLRLEVVGASALVTLSGKVVLRADAPAASGEDAFRSGFLVMPGEPLPDWIGGIAFGPV
ncbi:hypothetical protein SLNSH_14885 [Alsobacter soli]|uniref:Right handed beta helix domain-containing protein n=1 Tax=Alsobacter soli TaxID=2109933 RepID=A0A2T1HRK9_9HYPH|nr:hypothetical protein [Alsobacter soli]PSC04273.1 hypothetical protein SLNSH_14885 [Alsobacter soli]